MPRGGRLLCLGRILALLQQQLDLPMHAEALQSRGTLWPCQDTQPALCPLGHSSCMLSGSPQLLFLKSCPACFKQESAAMLGQCICQKLVNT